MDRKQYSIYLTILEKFNLPKETTFVQHRNLREFKYFEIERINPTHKIQLYGRLKNNLNKTNKSKKLINVGEILIGISTIIMQSNILLHYIDFISLLFSMFLLNCLLFYVFGDINILKVIYDYWNRGFSRRWKNCLPS